MSLVLCRDKNINNHLTVSLLLIGFRKDTFSSFPISDRMKGKWLWLRFSCASMKYSKLNKCAMMCTAAKGKETKQKQKLLKSFQKRENQSFVHYNLPVRMLGG